MVRGETVKQEIFVIKMDLNFNEDYPAFTTGKLYHIIQNVCKSYTGNFSVKRFDGGVVFENGEFKEQDQIVVKLSGVNEQEADMIASDLCAYLQLKGVYVSKEVTESHLVFDRVSSEE